MIRKKIRFVRNVGEHVEHDESNEPNAAGGVDRLSRASPADRNRRDPRALLGRYSGQISVGRRGRERSLHKLVKHMCYFSSPFFFSFLRINFFRRLVALSPVTRRRARSKSPSRSSNFFSFLLQARRKNAAQVVSWILLSRLSLELRY